MILDKRQQIWNTTGSFTRTDKKYHDTAAEQGFLECWVGS